MLGNEGYAGTRRSTWPLKKGKKNNSQLAGKRRGNGLAQNADGAQTSQVEREGNNGRPWEKLFHRQRQLKTPFKEVAMFF